ncbi:alpha/beta fold hydrolase [Clostridium sp. CS001]|uniref:alpha/beta fold hydrolase n=1 Tax=Clostridium sp. CS001 TaxID=2880648 RepID=UPI001CF1C07F|nr:alpha/beta hydrolase [Clostridium sp. CS001]MCB2291547.1 alpha/beta fold hydrolase [Clostridium sp. CS001]
MIEELVDIGTKKLEVNIYGTGVSTVVIETGMGCSWYDWCSVISEISKKATVLTYHRSGYGESTLGKEERSTKKIAEELNKLLERKGINSKMILVGHSFGGLCVQHFASLFPEKVLGVVLVDSCSVDEYKMDELRYELPSFRDKFPKTSISDSWRKLSLQSKLQLEAQMSPKLLPEQMTFTKEIQKCILEFQINPNMYSAMASELELMSRSGQEIKNSFNTLNVPLKVLARDGALGVKWNVDMRIPESEAIKFENLWHSLVLEEANLSTKGEFIEVKGSKHSIYRTNPGSVIKAINDVIEESK